jgi:hypothetical protein
MFSGIEKFKFYGRKDYNSPPSSDNQEEVGQAFHTYKLTPVKDVEDLKKDEMDTIYYLLPENYTQGRGDEKSKFIEETKLD